MAAIASMIPTASITPVMSIPVPLRPPSRRRPIKAPTGAAAFVNRMEIRAELCCWKRTGCSRLSLPLLTNTTTQSARSNAPFAFLNKNNNWLLLFNIVLVNSYKRQYYPSVCLQYLFFLYCNYLTSLLKYPFALKKHLAYVSCTFPRWFITLLSHNLKNAEQKQ